jgi:hypothetical protein
MRKYGGSGPFTVTEIGGANSCFYEKIASELRPARYIIVDNNQLGLDKFEERLGRPAGVELVNQDIFAPDPRERTDLVFSVGLIEHFDVAGTQRCILNHLSYLTRPGILILSFPTPTWLYRITRKCAEALSLWVFPDERPLRAAEVVQTVKTFGEVLDRKILWPIFLTQCMMVVKVPPPR